MNEFMVQGEEYDKLSKAVFQMNNGKSDLSRLQCWCQPFVFIPNTDVLKQTKGGPCGLFAVIQSHIYVARQRPENINVPVEDILISEILNIFQRVSPDFAFCTSFDPKHSVALFQHTQDRDEAFIFIATKNYLKSPQACLLLLISLTFTSAKMSSSFYRDEPYVFSDKMTTMSFVWLLLNGDNSDEALAIIEHNGYVSPTQQNIGIRVLKSFDGRTIGVWLNPNANVFVCLQGFHFFTVVVEGNDKLVIIDNYKANTIRTTTKNALGWK
ncbi:hypothetical protein GPJ56_002405 [Histomonas meleagridis]|uniref:uncharacterized protein n=1 Tax=Histomonas meleagridis TaxID=135588 RepID=UPI0035596055|nr:hypothetical protein GPJ56_002405 [Histomonas meleagridis]KAH0801864.1 hypothetical protein GO595_005282 [Histomonas meleagridis]